jgi:teichuronic acid biosynthesis glycosyltransferase TuaH
MTRIARVDSNRGPKQASLGAVPSYSARSEYAEATEEMDATADRLPVALAPVRPRATRPDLVFTFAFTSWSGAAARGFSFPEDRFAAALPGHPRVGRVLVCDPFRSAPRKLARALLRRADTPFPVSAVAAQHSPLRLRRHDPTSISAVERTYAAYERGIRQAALREGFERPVIVTANPLLAGFGDLGWAGPVTYYAWDDFAAYHPRSRWWEADFEAYRRIRAKGHRVVAVTAEIIDRISPAGPHAVVPNAVNEEEWLQLTEPPSWFVELPAPRLLYIGSLQSRIDVEQIRTVAAAFPEGSVALVGPLQEPDHFAPLRDLPNLHIHPQVTRSAVPSLIGRAQVGLIPHVRSELTEAMSPLKLYEYLAGGLPVAAVDLPGIAGISDRVQLVPPGADMEGAVRRALALGREREDRRLAFVSQHSWARRFDALLDIALAAE